MSHFKPAETKVQKGKSVNSAKQASSARKPAFRFKKPTDQSQHKWEISIEESTENWNNGRGSRFVNRRKPKPSNVARKFKMNSNENPGKRDIPEKAFTEDDIVRRVTVLGKMMEYGYAEIARQELPKSEKKFAARFAKASHGELLAEIKRWQKKMPS